MVCSTQDGLQKEPSRDSKNDFTIGGREKEKFHFIHYQATVLKASKLGRSVLILWKGITLNPTSISTKHLPMIAENLYCQLRIVPLLEIGKILWITLNYYCHTIASSLKSILNTIEWTLWGYSYTRYSSKGSSSW